MSASETGQVTRTAAEVYEELFVPALFREWAGRVAGAAQIGPGQRVLDVACGTGVLARAAADLAGPAGKIVGLDSNDGMLAVARRKSPSIDWRQGNAEALPFPDSSFDAVVCQFALMFFTDRQAALQEMQRVVRPGGTLAVAVWGALERSPGYAALTDLLQRLFGADAALSLHAPFVLGDQNVLRALVDEAGLADAQISTHTGTARFPSVAAWVHTEIKGWTLADQLDEAQFSLLLEQAESALKKFVADDGSVAFNVEAHIITSTKS